MNPFQYLISGHPAAPAEPVLLDELVSWVVTELHQPLSVATLWSIELQRRGLLEIGTLFRAEYAGQRGANRT